MKRQSRRKEIEIEESVGGAERLDKVKRNKEYLFILCFGK